MAEVTPTERVSAEERIKQEAREWLNKKHFTSDSGVTLDCLAMLPEEHAMAINIRQLCQIMGAFALSRLSEVEELRKQVAQWPKWGVVEVAVRNPQVAEYCEHWEGRVEAAESKLAAAEAELAKYTENKQVGTCVDCGTAIWFREASITDDSGTYHPICRVGKQQKTAEAEAERLRKELERANGSRKHTQDWYARHYGKLEDWARRVLPDPWRNQFFNCIANGLYDHAKDVGEPYICKAGFKVVPGGYFKMETAQQQILHDQTTRAEEAESSAETLSKRLREMEGALRRMEIIIPYQHCQTCNHFAAEIKAALSLPPSEASEPVKEKP